MNSIIKYKSYLEKSKKNISEEDFDNLEYKKFKNELLNFNSFKDEFIEIECVQYTYIITMLNFIRYKLITNCDGKYFKPEHYVITPSRRLIKTYEKINSIESRLPEYEELEDN